MARLTRRALAAAPFAFAAARAWAAAPAQPPAAAPTTPPGTPWPDATAMAAAIRSGQLSAAEAVETAIRRAEALQGTLNIIVNSDFDRALDKAKAGPPPGPSNGPFWGVPFLIKDLEDYRGLPTRYGSQSSRLDPPATRQKPLIDAYDRAGLVVIGKSATPEAGFLPSTEPVAFGPTRNPWDLARSTAGSSGGSAAAVAAGVVPAGHATDGGGSIRMPASHCGLVGLKPSRGRMAGTTLERRMTDYAAQNVLTRSVRDTAALFALGEDTNARAQHPPVGLVAGPSKRRLRIGVLLENGLGHRPSDDVMAANDDTAKLLSDLGHHVDYTHLPYDGAQFIDDFLLLWAQGALELYMGVSKGAGRPADATMLEPFTLSLVEVAKRSTPPVLQAAGDRLAANVLAYDTWYPAHLYDVVLSPVLSSGPPLLGEYAPTVPFDVLVPKLKEYVGYTPVHNLAGAPGISVPLHWSKDGLPIGSQLSARAGNERTLLELAYELELARPWASRIPPVHV